MPRFGCTACSGEPMTPRDDVTELYCPACLAAWQVSATDTGHGWRWCHHCGAAGIVARAANGTEVR